jgi:hypothetical protein
MALTAKRVTKLTTPGRYHDEHGLYLSVVSAANRHWLFRYERHGRERWLGLGSARDTDLKKARERARNARSKLWDGIDPIDARKAERAARELEVARTITFEKAAVAYFDAHEKQWRNAKHRAQFLSTLKMYAFSKIGSLPVAAIDVGLVLKVIEPIWHGKTETARRRDEPGSEPPRPVLVHEAEPLRPAVGAPTTRAKFQKRPCRWAQLEFRRFL